MFALRKETVEESTSAPVELLKPQPQESLAGVEPLGAYEKLAEELDFKPGQLLEEQLRRFMKDNHIPTYNYREVNEYMISLAEAEDKIWIWRPLRKSDAKKADYTLSGTKPRKKSIEEAYGHGSFRGDLPYRYRPYSYAIPIHILQRVKKIQDKFGKQVQFFVSDYAVPDPDPFIMVTAVDVACIVFGVWDEPGFSEDA